eukprot:gene7640-64501_t
MVGDLHGALSDLIRLTNDYGEPAEMNQYLFNGDFVDRGPWGPEVLFMLLLLRLLHPPAEGLHDGAFFAHHINDAIERGRERVYHHQPDAMGSTAPRIVRVPADGGTPGRQ